jgi:hypothetical protein
MLGVFVLMMMFDTKIKFVRDNVGWIYITITVLYAIITTKLIVCLMAKMTYSFVHPEYLVFGLYFYFQYNYQPTAEYDNYLFYSFLTVFLVLCFLYYRLVSVCIEQIGDNLGIY